MDQNGNVAALIKIVTSETGFVFDGGSLGIVDSKQKVGEIWVWVPYGSRKITILHQRLGVLRDYRYPIEIESECTYEMVLVTGKVNSYIEEEITEQWLVFEITPHDAILEVNDKMWPVSAEGTARSMMPFGSYTYRVQAPNYHIEAGRVEVNDPENSQVVTVTLRPNFGWIEVPGDNGLTGAAVYVDNALIGKAPCKSEALRSGSHNVRILKEMFEPYAVTVTVNDNETTRVAPTLTNDYARITLQVDADAEIWVNDEKKGTRTWTGDLPSGTYRIECKQPGHETTTTKKTVTSSMNGEMITLPAPIPLYGSLNVECTPDLATLYVDGKEMGKAPKLIGKIQVGQHELRLSKKGYTDHVETVTITQGVRTQVNATLASDGSATVTVMPQQQQPTTPQKERSIFFVTANVAYSLAPQASFGFSVGQVKRFGWFLSAMSNFNFKAMQYEYTTDAEGFVDGEYPNYTEASCKTRISVMGGALVRVAKPLCIRAGVGYGMRVKSWYTNDNKLVRMTDDSWTGVDVSLGAQLHLKGFVISLDAVTTSFKNMEIKAGLGYNW